MSKRVLDIVLALIGLVSAAPAMAVIAIAVIAASGRPVLFTQDRVGLSGAPFRLRKFRSMRDSVDSNGEPLPDAERITKIGALLRRSRLDELPELWLILTGKMSVVGPRPLPANILYAQPGELTPYRLAVRPGLTGLAQVSGGTLLTNYEKFAIDALYVDTHGTLSDLAIMARTVLVVTHGDRRNEVVVKKAIANAHRFSRDY